MPGGRPLGSLLCGFGWKSLSLHNTDLGALQLTPTSFPFRAGCFKVLRVIGKELYSDLFIGFFPEYYYESFASLLKVLSWRSKFYLDFNVGLCYWVVLHMSLLHAATLSPLSCMHIAIHRHGIINAFIVLSLKLVSWFCFHCWFSCGEIFDTS